MQQHALVCGRKLMRMHCAVQPDLCFYGIDFKPTGNHTPL
jgi:hypothetical protein